MIFCEAFFTLVPNKWLSTATLDIKYNVQSDESCGSFCIADIRCLSFDYSKTTKSDALLHETKLQINHLFI